MTVTTQAATTAQVAFNTVILINIYVAIASAIIGLQVAVDSYIGSTKKPLTKPPKMDEETKKTN